VLPPVAVTLIALIGSLGLHLPAYVGLGVLKALLEDEKRPAPARPVQIEIVESSPTEVARETAPTEAPVPVEETLEEPRERSREVAQAAPPPAPTPPPPEAEPPPAVPPPTPAQAPPPPPETTRRTSVTHRSRDPNVPPPDDAQFLAEQNSRVEEETIARVRNNQTDDPEPQLAAPQEETPNEPDPGDASEQRSAELREAEGSDERTPTPEEARLPDEPPPEQRPSRSRTPNASEAARGDAREGASEEEPGRPREVAGGGRQASGGGERPLREVIVSDGNGTFRIRVPNERPQGEGEGEGGGLAVSGEGRGQEGDGVASGRAGSGRRRARGGGAGGRGAPDLRVSWTDFASLYGEEELQRQRELWLEQRRSRTRGASHQERWEQFRAAIENYTAQVRPGNQTALNTRADPFAAYLAEVHRRIHVRFADSFLRALPSTVEAVYRGNPNMHTKLEIALGPDGRVARIGVIATSGDILFDFGAYNAVMRAQPFAASPEAIRSPDGLVYMHWSFYRNERQCGTFNAEPYILARAPSGPAPALPSLDADAVFAPSPEAPRRRSSRDTAPRDDGPVDGPVDGPRRAPRDDP
jgi:hypothetical protein